METTETTQLYSSKHLNKKLIEIREEALADFYTFIQLVAPYLELGKCHEEAAKFIANPNETHKLLIYPRACLKSKLLSLYVVWRIINDPTITVLYASATASLAEAQLFSIKNYLDSNIITKLFPELMNKTKEGKRDKWSQSAINVEHPLRQARGIRDNTVFAVGAGKNITGLHFDLLALDDIVAPNTDVDPWTLSGRTKASRWVSLATSILNPGGEVVGAGTIYHSKDIYYELMEIKEPVLDENNELLEEVPLYDVKKEQIEEHGEFLWPRRKGKDGKYYGFDHNVLARIKASYIDKAIFFCFHPDTTVYTDNGYKKISNLNTDDYFNNNKVINIFNRYVEKGEMTEVSIAGMADRLLVTKGHEFPVRIKTRKKDYGESVEKIGNIQNNDVVTKRYYFKHPFNVEVIDNKFDELDWWLIGHYLAEGHKHSDGKAVSLCTRLDSEKDIHSKLLHIINEKNLHYRTYDFPKYNVKRWEIIYPELFEYLTEFGYYSYGKHLNKDALNLNKSKSESLLDGYWKGDGYSLKQGGYGITSVSIELLEGFKDLLLRLGHCPYIHKLYDAGSRKAFGYDVRDTWCIRWTPNSQRPQNFIENGVYYQLVTSVKDYDYEGYVYTCEVENTHEYNVNGLVCKNSQYYNNPNDPENKKIDPKLFQYYDRSQLQGFEHTWVINGKQLTVYAALDMAMTVTKKSDYTALVIVGVDEDNFRYVLDIERMKTDKISDMTSMILSKYSKWRWIKLRVETNQAQGLVARQIQDTCVMKGAVFAWDFKASRSDKEIRILSILEPLYEQQLMFHYKGGNIEFLENELVQSKPDHDDTSDALAMVMEIIPFKFKRRNNNINKSGSNIYHPVFGGVA